MDKIQPGVVTGKDYQILVERCKQNKFALAAVNISYTPMLNAALEAAGSTKTDIIIQVSNGGAQYFAGKGLENAQQAKVLGAISVCAPYQVVSKSIRDLCSSAY